MSDFFKRLFHAANPELFTYFSQFNNSTKKVGKTQGFSMKLLDQMKNAVTGLNHKPYSLHFSMGLLDHFTTKRASDKDIVALPCLHCDIDVVAVTHADSNLFPDVASVIKMLETEIKPRGLYPNIVVSSGYGVHLYWILERCIITKSDSEKQDARNILIKIQSIVRNCSNGYTVDKTGDLSRMLRVPGSKNWKGDPDIESAPTAEVIFDDGLFFQNDVLSASIDKALESFLPAHSTPPEMSQTQINAVEKMRQKPAAVSINSSGDVQMMIDNCNFIRHVVENFNVTAEPMIKDALSNLLHASNGYQFAVDLCKNRFGADFDESKTDERLKHYLIDSKPTSCKTIRDSCKFCNVDSCIVNRLGKKVPAAIVTSDNVSKAIESNSKTLFDVVDDVPADIADFHIPEGYAISNAGIFDLQSGKFALNSLVFISKITTEADRVVSDGVKTQLANRDFFTLTIKKNNHWIHISATPEQILNSKSVVDVLAPFGVNITSIHSKIAALFFNNFKVKNENLIPRIDRFTKIGWHGDQFILPRENVNYEIDAGETVKEIYQKGNRDNFIDLLKRCLKFKAVKIFVAASLAATFISKINCRNFTIHIFARTGTGKTAAMRLAAALWGSPQFMTQLNATFNGLESVVAEHNDLPSLFNELQVMKPKDREYLGEFIHRFEIGQSKIRLNKNSSMRPVKTFNGIMMITAEQPLAEDNAIGGVLTRIFEVPLNVAIGTFENGQYNTDNDLCHEIYDSTQENFGFIGPEFVQHFVDNPNEFEHAKSIFNEWRRRLLAERNDEISASHADYIAAMTTAYNLFNDWILHVDELDNEVLTNDFAFNLLKDVKSKNELSDTARALDYLRDWRLQHYQNFFDSTDPSYRPKEVFGLIHQGNLYVIPKIAKEALEAGGFVSAKILREFAQEGIIKFDEKNNRAEILCRNPLEYEKRARFIVFTRFDVDKDIENGDV